MGDNKKPTYQAVTTVGSVRDKNARVDEWATQTYPKSAAYTSKEFVNFTYKNPPLEAAQTIAGKTETEISDLIAELVSAGYFKRDEIKFFPMGSENGQLFYYPQLSGQTKKYLTTALVRAFEDANATVTGEYVNIANTRRNEIAATQRGEYFGETALESAKIKADATGGASKPTITSYVYTRAKSDQTLDTWYKENLGRKATDSERASFYKTLSKKQMDPKNASKYTTTTVGGRTVVMQEEGGVNVEDEIVAFALGKINLADNKQLGTGKINDNVTAVRSYAKQYGVGLSGKKLIDYSRSLIDGTMTEQSLRQQFANTAKTLYRGIADKLDEQTSVYDEAKSYINRKAQILEMNPETFNIKDVEFALTGDAPMDYNNFDAMVRKDPRFQNTTTAKNSALAFAQNIARSFGYGA